MPLNNSTAKKQKDFQKKLYLEVIKGLNLSKRKGYTLKKMFENQYRNLNLGVLSRKDELDKQIANYEYQYINRGQNYDDMQFIRNTQYAIQQGMFPVHNYKLGQWIGVEIECTMPYPKSIKRKLDRDFDFQDLTAECHKVLKEEFKKLNMNYIDVKYDGSIHIEDENYFGVELTLCFINDVKGLNKLERLCSYLEKSKAKVNKSCGLHVHLDMRGYVKSEIQAQSTRLINALPALFRLVPGTRMNNRYCKMNKEFTWHQSDKYYAVNMLSYDNHETVEIRLHSGTTNYEKISNWIKLLSTIRHAKEFTNTQVTIAKNPTAYLFDAINLDSETQRFFFKREVNFEESNRQDSELETGSTLSRAQVRRSRSNDRIEVAPLEPPRQRISPIEYNIQYNTDWVTNNTVYNGVNRQLDNPVVNESGSAIIASLQESINRLSQQIIQDSVVFGTGMLRVDTEGSISVTNPVETVNINSSDELRDIYNLENNESNDSEDDIF